VKKKGRAPREDEKSESIHGEPKAGRKEIPPGRGQGTLSKIMGKGQGQVEIPLAEGGEPPRCCVELFFLFEGGGKLGGGSFLP